MRARVVIVALVIAFGSSAPSVKAATIAETITSSGGVFDGNRLDYDLFMAAMTATDLVDRFDGGGSFTFFAPNDLAFMKTARELGFKGYDESGVWRFLIEVLAERGGGDPIPLMRRMVLSHFSPEPIRAHDFVYRSFFDEHIDTLAGRRLIPSYSRLAADQAMVAEPKVLFLLSRRVDNGLVHPITRLMLPA